VPFPGRPWQAVALINLDFLLLVLLTAIYLVRPADLVPSMATVPFFQIIILPCLFFSMGAWTKKLNWESLRESPVTLCVLALLGIAFVSQIVNAPSEMMRTVNFAKGCVFYLLIVSLVDTEQRLLAYLKWTAFFLFVLGLSMIATSKGWIGDLEYTTNRYATRIGAAGGQTFDPNDAAALLVPGILLCGHFALTVRSYFWKVVWAGLGAATGYSFVLTESRGGLLGLAVGGAAYLWLRWGIRGLVGGALLGLPVVARFLTSRMVEVDAVSEGTGQLRIQLWHSGLVLLKQNLPLGIGPDRFTDVVTKSCHNSFLEAFAELGLIGGILFAGAFFFCAVEALRIQKQLQAEVVEGEKSDSTPAVIFAIVMGYAAAIFALNHVYTGCTYLILGVGSSCHDVYRAGREDRLGLERALKEIAFGGVACLVFIYVISNVLVKW
jgi:O-antigen ligase